ncbi:MAG: hypothetical protein RR575_16400 [Acinetobacter sp.]
MKTKSILTFLSLALVLQSCSLFNNTPCHDEQVIESVKKLYANQININPLSKIDQLRSRLTQNSTPVKDDSQSIIGIDLKQIKQLNIEKLKSENNPESQAILDIIHDRFEGAQYICKATIKQEINTSKLTEIAQQLNSENAKLIQKNKLNIPIVYAIYTQDGNKPYDVQYSPENTLHLMLAMILKKSS